MFDPAQVQSLILLTASHPWFAFALLMSMVLVNAVFALRGLVHSVSKATERTTRFYIVRRMARTTDQSQLNALTRAMDALCGREGGDNSASSTTEDENDPPDPGPWIAPVWCRVKALMIVDMRPLDGTE
jgi:hypothetical protein